MYDKFILLFYKVNSYVYAWIHTWVKRYQAVWWMRVGINSQLSSISAFSTDLKFGQEEFKLHTDYSWVEKQTKPRQPLGQAAELGLILSGKNCVKWKYFNSNLCQMQWDVLIISLCWRILVYFVWPWLWCSTWAILKWQFCKQKSCSRLRDRTTHILIFWEINMNLWLCG